VLPPGGTFNGDVSFSGATLNVEYGVSYLNASGCLSMNNTEIVVSTNEQINPGTVDLFSYAQSCGISDVSVIVDSTSDCSATTGQYQEVQQSGQVVGQIIFSTEYLCGTQGLLAMGVIVVVL
jgi:hypothetical protein